jgi:hypothetical protein
MPRDEELELQIDLRRSLRTWRYYRDEKEDSYNLLKIYSTDMDQALRLLIELYEKEKIENPESSQAHTEPDTPVEEKISADEVVESSDEGEELAEPMEEFPSWMKKLYRDIAIKTHPDKLMYTSGSQGTIEQAEDETTQRFIDAKTFYQEKNTAALLDMAVDLDLGLNRFEVSETRGVIDYITANTYQLRQEIMLAQGSTLWMWGRADGNKLIMMDALGVHAQSVGIRGFTKQTLEDVIDKFLDISK